MIFLMTVTLTEDDTGKMGDSFDVVLCTVWTRLYERGSPTEDHDLSLY